VQSAEVTGIWAGPTCEEFSPENGTADLRVRCPVDCGCTCSAYTSPDDPCPNGTTPKALNCGHLARNETTFTVAWGPSCTLDDTLLDLGAKCFSDDSMCNKIGTCVSNCLTPDSEAKQDIECVASP
jgi:hypothetical protein